MAPFVKNIKPTHEERIQTFSHPQLKTITITFKEKLYKHDSGMGRNAKEQFKLAYNTIIRDLAGNYVIVAELTKQGNIHFHGLLYTHDEYGTDIIKDDMKRHKLFGLPQIDTPNNTLHLETFKKYMMKDYEKTLTIINKNTKHEDDIQDIVISSVSPKRGPKGQFNIRRWAEGDEDGSLDPSSSSPSCPSPSQLNIITQYTMEDII